MGRKGAKIKAGVSYDTQSRPLHRRVWKTIRTINSKTTPGASSTVDGMSLRRIDDIIKRLEEGTYQWKPVKRVYIEKKNGKLRPLGLPGWNDKLRKVSSE